MELNGTINEILKEKDVQERMQKFGMEPRYDNYADTVKFFNSEINHWGKMVKTLNLSIN